MKCLGLGPCCSLGDHSSPLLSLLGVVLCLRGNYSHYSYDPFWFKVNVDPLDIHLLCLRAVKHYALNPNLVLEEH